MSHGSSSACSPPQAFEGTTTFYQSGVDKGASGRNTVKSKSDKQWLKLHCLSQTKLHKKYRMLECKVHSMDPPRYRLVLSTVHQAANVAAVSRETQESHGVALWRETGDNKLFNIFFNKSFFLFPRCHMSLCSQLIVIVMSCRDNFSKLSIAHLLLHSPC